MSGLVSERDWASTARWVKRTMREKPVGFVFDLGPSGYGPIEEDEGIPAPCIQLQVFEGDVLMLRRSNSVLRRLLIADFSVGELPLDEWLDGDHFGDCTGGYIFTRDIDLAVETTVSWFRDISGWESGNLGCEYEFPDVLVAYNVDGD